MPEDGYGWEKLFSERMCRHYIEDYGLETRVGPLPQRLRSARDLARRTREGTGRDLPQGASAKRRASRDRGLGRRQADAQLHLHRRLHRGHARVAAGPLVEPVNLGASELVTIDGLVDIVEEIGGTELQRVHDLEAPQGVRGRNSDNTLFAASYGWEPATPLRDGLAKTYAWIEGQVASAETAGAARG